MSTTQGSKAQGKQEPEQASQGKLLSDDAVKPSTPDTESEVMETVADAEIKPDDSIGASLRVAREAKGIAVADVARALKLSPRQVELLESNTWSGLPGMTFVRGFLRNYARFLQIDASVLLARLAAETTGGKGQELELPDSTHVEIPYAGEEHKSFAFVTIGGLLVVVALLIYFLVPASVFEVSSGNTVNTERAGVSPTSSMSDEKRPVTAETSNTSGVSTEPSVMQPSVDPADAGKRGVSEAQAAKSPVQVVSTQAKSESKVDTKPLMPTAVTAAVDTTLVPVAPVERKPVPDGPLREVSFVVDTLSWVEVHDAGPNQVFADNLSDGVRRSVKAVAPLEVVVGNAAGVNVFIDGVPLDLKSHTRANVARVRVE